tara:strand:+ start:47 stop:1087 length:1041 start_codon:yes stop_codon:yes gene_type:complete
MIKYLFNKTRFVVRYILIIFLAFVIIESVSRGFVMAVTKDFKVFLYGFNKDIKIDIFHLRKLDIKLTDLYLINQSMLKNKSNYKKQMITGEKIKIWTFGGSTSVGKTCGKNASSWPDELVKLNHNIEIDNFSLNGVDSERSLYEFRQGILKKKVPKIVIWAHKFNEINVIYQGLRANKYKINHVFPNQSKNKLNLLFLKLDVTFKDNFLSYKILDNFIISVSRKIIRNFEKERINKDLNNEDFEYASINYKIHVTEAIKLSKENGIEKFILLSLPSRHDYEEKMKDLFFIHYYKKVKELIKDDFVNFIDISNHSKFANDNENFFCDEVHKTLLGNSTVAEILNKYF